LPLVLILVSGFFFLVGLYVPKGDALLPELLHNDAQIMGAASDESELRLKLEP
jgi:hypothetical protein